MKKNQSQSIDLLLIPPHSFISQRLPFPRFVPGELTVCNSALGFHNNYLLDLSVAISVVEVSRRFLSGCRVLCRQTWGCWRTLATKKMVVVAESEAGWGGDSGSES